MGEMSANGWKGPITPAKFKGSLARKYSQFGGSRQQDAHEFLMIMLDQLSEFRKECLGQTVSTVTCLTCNHVSEKKEGFTCLNIEIPQNAEKSPLTLLDCIKETFMEEMIADGWSCSQCGAQNSGVKKEVYVKELPRLLIVQLKRFRCTGRGYVKDKSAVKLPRGSFKFKNTRFDLKGVVNHMGSMNAGHYTANIKVNNRWKRCNDARVTEEDKMVWNSQSAYLLFMEQE